ncbi:MAG TPA: DegT/DnrJ/EryC1/StrS family aminotransferase, partial [Cyclobacteriaceae bacterium]|nr:DegT/DnrJ/EryC1/StrS family aminotransferase [Cyclobacteriaceae bacterium]
MIEYENLQKLNAPFKEAYVEQFKKVNESGWYILGNEVRKFESDFASFCQTQYCAGVANGLDALIVSL